MNETLLYVILAILYLIFTIIGRVAKKKQQSSQEEQQPRSLEDTLRDLAGYTEESPEVTPIPPVDWPDPRITYDTPTPTPIKVERIPSSPSASPPPHRPPSPSPDQSIPPHQKTITASKIASQLNNPESAQTAIILSEILGKPRATRRFSGHHPRR